MNTKIEADNGNRVDIAALSDKQLYLQLQLLSAEVLQRKITQHHVKMQRNIETRDPNEHSLRCNEAEPVSLPYVEKMLRGKQLGQQAFNILTENLVRNDGAPQSDLFIRISALQDQFDDVVNSINFSIRL